MFEKVVLCSPPRCSCPEIHYNRDKKTIILTDDYHGSVLLTFEEMLLLINKFQKIRGKDND